MNESDCDILFSLPQQHIQAPSMQLSNISKGKQFMCLTSRRSAVPGSLDPACTTQVALATGAVPPESIRLMQT